MARHAGRRAPRVVVSGLGVVSPYGAGVKSFWTGLSAGACAIRPSPPSRRRGCARAWPRRCPRRSWRARGVAAPLAGRPARARGGGRGAGRRGARRPRSAPGGPASSGRWAAACTRREAWYWEEVASGRPVARPARAALRPAARARRRAGLPPRARGPARDAGDGVRLRRRLHRAGRGPDPRRRGRRGAGRRRRRAHAHLLHGLQCAQAARPRAVPALRPRPPRHVDRRGRRVPRARGRRALPRARAGAPTRELAGAA